MSTWRIEPPDEGEGMKRLCPVCLKVLSWRYPAEEGYGNMSLGHAWCPSHGRLRVWYVGHRGLVFAVGSGMRGVRGRLLKEPVLAKPRSWNAHTMRRYSPRFRR